MCSDDNNLSADWIEKNLYRFPWYKPYFNMKNSNLELRSLEEEEEEE